MTAIALLRHDAPASFADRPAPAAENQAPAASWTIGSADAGLLRDLDAATLADLAAYWQTIRRDRAMPRRGDLDPLDMPPRLLPYLELLERRPDGGFRFRLVGTAVDESFGARLTGRDVAEVLQAASPAFRDFAGALLHLAQLSQRPVFASAFMRWDMRWQSGRFASCRILLLPLSDEKRQLSHLLASLCWQRHDRTVMPPRAADYRQIAVEGVTIQTIRFADSGAA